MNTINPNILSRIQNHYVWRYFKSLNNLTKNFMAIIYVYHDRFCFDSSHLSHMSQYFSIFNFIFSPYLLSRHQTNYAVARVT